MRSIRTLVIGVAAVLCAHPAQAQEQGPPFTLATYYQCDYVNQAKADTIYRRVMAPALDRQIRAGNLTSYAFSSHRIGGEFRRLEGWTAPSLELLMTAQEAFFNDLNATNPTGMAEFNVVCGSHEDYLWVRTLTSAPDRRAGETQASGR